MLQRIINLFRLPKHLNVYPRFCEDCKWSMENKPSVLLHCKHPAVNGRNPYALGSRQIDYNQVSSCWTERDNKNGQCSLVGFLWEPKDNT